jgi:hypothetical protein
MHQLLGQSVIGVLLLISASAHRQLVHSLNKIFRSPASKEADAGGGSNGHHSSITHGNRLRTYKRECR